MRVKALKFLFIYKYITLAVLFRTKYNKYFLDGKKMNWFIAECSQALQNKNLSIIFFYVFGGSILISPQLPSSSAQVLFIVFVSRLLAVIMSASATPRTSTLTSVHFADAFNHNCCALSRFNGSPWKFLFQSLIKPVSLYNTNYMVVFLGY
jgi:hypothetical protein